jgi:hypothetical protein
VGNAQMNLALAKSKIIAEKRKGTVTFLKIIDE